MSGSGAAWQAMRPKHWTKNFFVLAPLVFSQRLTDVGADLRALAAFGVFCALSSSVYLINDLADRDADRHHPRKRNRPIASGRLSVRTASWMAGGLAVGALASAPFLGIPFAGVACAYLLMNLAYSFSLKRVVILDVMMVSAGFLLRAWAGALVLEVEMSHWLVLCTYLVALFLSFVKRRQEILGMEDATLQRESLKGYSLPFLDQMIAVVTSSTILAYSLYAFSPETAVKLGTPHMWVTIPFVLFGVFRYLYLVHQRGEGDNPTAVILSDGPMFATIALWSVLVILLLLFAA